MSQRIDRLLEVLTEIMTTYERGKPRSIRKARAVACETVAIRHGINPQSVADIIRRQLAPEIANAQEFDELAVGWLEEGADALPCAVKARASDEDKEAVERYFSDPRSRPVSY